MPGIPEAMVNSNSYTKYFHTRANSVTDALVAASTSYASGMWADAGFGACRTDTIGITEIDWSHGRPPSHGPSQIQWEGFVSYSGTPTASTCSCS